MVTQPLTIALIPLDERPVNTRCPQMLGAIGGADVLLPPVEIRGRQRVPAELPAVAAWLGQSARTADAAIVSAEYFGCGNLINARISEDSAGQILSRLQALSEINPHCPVHAFSLITRVSNADDAVEEPEYWAEWGTRFYRYARLTHQAELGVLTEPEELARLEAALPPGFKTDWLIRRLRNHTVNLGLLEMAARGSITSLRLTSDDTSLYGFPSRERDWLAGWPRLIGSALTERVMMHPGADEVGSALLAKILMARHTREPRVFVVYSHAGGEALIAPYEDRPVRETVEGQIRACGGVPVGSIDGAEIVLGVATPVPGRGDYRAHYLADDRMTRADGYKTLTIQLSEWQAHGLPVALADVAYPNGADPLLMEVLLAEDAPLNLGELAAYGAWNTAGNTLGVVIAQAFCAELIGDSPERRAAQTRFLAHRFLEDWGYQTLARREVRLESERLRGRQEPNPDNPDEQAVLCAFLESRLRERFDLLQTCGVGQGLTLIPGSICLPWHRTFEVDFMLSSA